MPRNSLVSQPRPRIKPQIVGCRYNAQFYNDDGNRLRHTFDNKPLKIQALDYARCETLAKAQIATFAESNIKATFKIVGVEVR